MLICDTLINYYLLTDDDPGISDLVKCLGRLEATICSRTLIRTQISEIGLLLEASNSPLLKIGETFARYKIVFEYLPISRKYELQDGGYLIYL